MPRASEIAQQVEWTDGQVEAVGQWAAHEHSASFAVLIPPCTSESWSERTVDFLSCSDLLLDFFMTCSLRDG
jgi:hypothetical protein